jgi:hypothetical protein
MSTYKKLFFLFLCYSEWVCTNDSQSVEFLCPTIIQKMELRCRGWGEVIQNPVSSDSRKKQGQQRLNAISSENRHPIECGAFKKWLWPLWLAGLVKDEKWRQKRATPIHRITERKLWRSMEEAF